MPVNTPLRQSQFNYNVLNNGVPLQFQYGGNWTANTATKAVQRAALPSGVSAAINSFGLTGYSKSGSDYIKERLEKWGRSYTPNASVLFPMQLPTANLVGIQDTRNPGSPLMDVITVAPDTISEGIYHMAYVRSQPVYNERVTIVRAGRKGDTEIIIMQNAPCRLGIPSGGGAGAGGNDMSDSGITSFVSPVLEMPYIYDSATGNLIILSAINYSVYSAPFYIPGTSPLARKYIIQSPDLLPGGDDHHFRFQLTLAAQ